MKKRTTALLTAVLLTGASGAAIAAGTDEQYKGFPIVNVVVNGKTVQGEAPGINLDGTTLVPFRAIGEALKADIRWDPATSTASLTLAANTGTGSASPEKPQPQKDERRAKMEEEVRALYDMTEAYFEQLEVVRERIRIAKDFYEVKKNDYYFQQMADQFWRKFEEQFAAILTKSSGDLMNEAKRTDLPAAAIVQTAEKAHAAMASYKLSWTQLQMHYTSSKPEFLEYYIMNYSNAFEDELKAKDMLKAAAKELEKAVR
ncbi:stalk domain-containing protein [Paenibacillus flagellatus]|nr:stalk domain-containing protein [Paenibacillus flagellatus]